MSNVCVLLVDDDRDMVSIGEQIFKKPGYEFFAAQSGKEGLGQILKLKPDVVILDYLLADMKGHDFIREIAENPAYQEVRDTPFVILTAWEEEPEKLNELYERGLRAYLSKPFGHRELRCVIENIVHINRLGGKQNGHAPPPPETMDAVHRNGVDEILWDECSDLACSIMGLSKMILNGLEGEIDEQQKTGLTAIYNSGKLLNKKIALHDQEAK